MAHSKIPVDFFEKIELNTLDQRAGRFNVQSDEHFIFSIEDKYRGIKRTVKKIGHPFFFTHEETLDTACAIYKRLYKKDPTEVHYFHDEDKTWNGFVVSEDLTNKGVIQPSLVDQYYPLIGAFNGYGMDENPAFFMLISSPFGKEKRRTSYLTIDSFRFLSSVEKECVYKEKASSKPTTYRFKPGLYGEFIEKVTSQFKEEEEIFNSLLKTYQAIPLEEKYFMPIILDLYNKNRNTESVKNDDNLINSILKLKRAAEEHLKFSNRLTWASFIGFIVRYNEFELVSGVFPKADIESLFSKKKAYTKMREIFGKCLHDTVRFNNYAENQLAEWYKIEALVNYFGARGRQSYR